MSTLPWLPILIKALSTGLLVVLASALAEALGPFWGALVASLPVSAGPAYVFLAMQHDGQYVAASALASTAANAATGLFLIIYAALAGRAPLWPALGAAVTAWLAASLAVRQITWTPETATLLNLIVYGVGLSLPQATTHITAAPKLITRRRCYDLPLRAAAVAAFVTAVVFASALFGPQAIGMAAVFPVSLISLIVILHPRIGGPASARLAATALRAMLGFALMLLVLHLAIQPWGTATALAAALVVSLAWSAGLLLLQRRNA